MEGHKAIRLFGGGSLTTAGDACLFDENDLGLAVLFVVIKEYRLLWDTLFVGEFELNVALERERAIREMFNWNNLQGITVLY